MTPYAEVIGDPIAHSKSPLIHGFWLEKLGIEGRYDAVRVTEEGVRAYLEARRSDPAWRGCNVTVPHKIMIMDFVSDPGDVRDTVGAMNTVVCKRDGTLSGANTDAAGFFAPIADLALEGSWAAVIGAGGAAHAVLFALARARVGRVTLLARSSSKGAALLVRFGLSGEVIDPGDPLPPVSLLVNASVLGMVGKAQRDFDLTPLVPDALVYDLVYAPLLTPLLASASRRGLATVDGLAMLVGQAALAFEQFFGATPPREHDEELRALLTA